MRVVSCYRCHRIAKDLKVSTSITKIANCEILRSAQNDLVGN